MATPTPIRTPQAQTQPQLQAQAQAQPQQQQPLHHIKSAARKLPIKRKTSFGPPTSSPSPTRSIPTAINSSTSTSSTLTNPQPFSIIVDDGDDGGNLSVVVAAPTPNEIDDDYDAESDGAESDPSPTSATPMGQQPAVAEGAVPFKFHRIWSEVDEIRFLEGLLGCHGEGLVFPRDLNLFFDRFRGTMTTPYSRSQLSEKLRRLRKKFRIASSRIARGLSAASMSPHDRALYDLSARLWHPSFAEGSPFTPPGTDAPKRRRRIPSSTVEDHPQMSNNSGGGTYNSYDHQNSHNQQSSYIENDQAKPIPISVHISPPPPHPSQPLSVPSPLPILTPVAAAALPLLENGPMVVGDAEKSPFSWLTPKMEPCTPTPVAAAVSIPAYRHVEADVVGEPNQGSIKQLVVKAVLDVFDDAVKDAQLLLPPPVAPTPGWSEQLALVDPRSHLLLFRRAEFANKWQEQRAAELNAVASRLRLVIERTIQS